MSISSVGNHLFKTLIKLGGNISRIVNMFFWFFCNRWWPCTFPWVMRDFLSLKLISLPTKKNIKAVIFEIELMQKPKAVEEQCLLWVLLNEQNCSLLLPACMSAMVRSLPGEVYSYFVDWSVRVYENWSKSWHKWTQSSLLEKCSFGLEWWCSLQLEWRDQAKHCHICVWMYVYRI